MVDARLRLDGAAGEAGREPMSTRTLPLSRATSTSISNRSLGGGVGGVGENGEVGVGGALTICTSTPSLSPPSPRSRSSRWPVATRMLLGGLVLTWVVRRVLAGLAVFSRSVELENSENLDDADKGVIGTLMSREGGPGEGRRSWVM